MDPITRSPDDIDIAAVSAATPGGAAVSDPSTDAPPAAPSAEADAPAPSIATGQPFPPADPPPPAPPATKQANLRVPDDMAALHPKGGYIAMRLLSRMERDLDVLTGGKRAATYPEVEKYLGHALVAEDIAPRGYTAEQAARWWAMGGSAALHVSATGVRNDGTVMFHGDAARPDAVAPPPPARANPEAGNQEDGNPSDMIGSAVPIEQMLERVAIAEQPGAEASMMKNERGSADNEDAGASIRFADIGFPVAAQAALRDVARHDFLSLAGSDHMKQAHQLHAGADRATHQTLPSRASPGVPPAPRVDLSREKAALDAQWEQYNALKRGAGAKLDPAWDAGQRKILNDMQKRIDAQFQSQVRASRRFADLIIPHYDSLTEDQASAIEKRAGYSDSAPTQTSFMRAHPMDASQAYELGKMAEADTAREYAGQRSWRNEADAFKHSDWTIRLQRRFGSTIAAQIEDGHESLYPVHGLEQRGDRLQDITNNHNLRILSELFPSLPPAYLAKMAIKAGYAQTRIYNIVPNPKRRTSRKKK